MRKNLIILDTRAWIRSVIIKFLCYFGGNRILCASLVLDIFYGIIFQIFFFFFFLHVKQLVFFCSFPQFVIVTKYGSKRFISVNSFNRIDLPFFFLFFRLYSFQSIDRHIIQLLFVFVPITCKRNIVFLWNVI